MPNLDPKQIYDYLRSKGLNDTQAQGILANVKAESSYDPSAIGDSGTSGGLFQHHAERFANMKRAAGNDWAKNWQGQIDYALSEPDTAGYLKQNFSSPAEASAHWTKYWERPANADKQAQIRAQHLAGFTGFSNAPTTPTMLAGEPAQTNSPIASQPPIERPRRKKTFLASLGDFFGSQIPLVGNLRVLFDKNSDVA